LTFNGYSVIMNANKEKTMNYEKGYATLWNAMHYAVYILKNVRDIDEVIFILEKALFEGV